MKMKEEFQVLHQRNSKRSKPQDFPLNATEHYA